MFIIQVPITFKGYSDAELKPFKNDPDITFTGIDTGKIKKVISAKKLAEIAINAIVTIVVNGVTNKIQKGTKEDDIQKKYGTTINIENMVVQNS